MSASECRSYVLCCLLCLSCGDSHPRSEDDSGSGSGGTGEDVSDAGAADLPDEAPLSDLNGKELTTVCAEADAQLAHDETTRTNLCTLVARILVSTQINNPNSDPFATKSHEERCLAEVQRCLDDFAARSLCSNLVQPTCTATVGDLRQCAAWHRERFSLPMPSCDVPLDLELSDPVPAGEACQRVNSCFYFS